MAQTQAATTIATDSPSSTSPSAASSITSSPTGDSASTSSDIALSLWAIADSLLTSYYPSTTITQVASLTWPTAVAIDGTTYSVHSGSTGGVLGSPTTSVLAEATNDSTGSSSPHHSLTSDKKLGIIIGVVVGTIVFGVLGLVFCCLWRRKKASGSYILRRPTPSITESDLDTWRSPRQFEASTLSSGPSREWTKNYNRMSTQERLAPPPPMAMHPAYVRQYSSQSTSEENPFFTPRESPDHYEMEGGQMHRNELDAGEAPSQRRSSSSVRRASRPPTPFSPMAMMASSSAPQQQQHHNPFASPEDGEADDVISPIIPSKSPERRHSPMVHYPSWNEVSEFDFGGQGRVRPSLRDQSSSEEGGDGWRPARRESVIGRHELA
ncbi:hypothetical protein LTR36_005318 [Oleoguttula mirabilis]|uniref:Uncharacterized protein n=1 Tax=Oleoguttula mirabilis TaxID=1507867 RepID=A0AAV9JFU9_9PEZI|nr:hypothetical protein LTR36_005318 [Oleoguttula mirabilis]